MRLSFRSRHEKALARLQHAELPAVYGRGSIRGSFLGDLAVLHCVTVLPLNRLHLVFEAQLELLKPDFF